MSTFPKRFGPDVEVEEVDLDTADVRYRGKRLNEAEAERVADDVLSRTPGRPSLSGPRRSRRRSPNDSRSGTAPALNRWQPSGAADRRRSSGEALDDYLSRHAG